MFQYMQIYQLECHFKFGFNYDKHNLNLFKFADFRLKIIAYVQNYKKGATGVFN